MALPCGNFFRHFGIAKQWNDLFMFGTLTDKGLTYPFFYKRLGSGLSPQSCLYFQGFWGSKLLNGSLIVV